MTTKRSLNRYVGRCLIAALPLLALIIIYIVLDPFKVLNPQLEPKGSIEPYNKGLISVSTYYHQRTEQKYNAFIFGSSRTIYYRADDWARHLPSEASIIHFDASSETIDGILQKMQYICHMGDSIKHALIEFAPWSFETQPSDGLPFRTPPQLTGDIPLEFLISYFRDFMRRDFIRSYAIYQLTGKIIEFGDKKVFAYSTFDYDNITNECISDSIENLINTNPSLYYRNRFTQEEFATIISRDSIPPVYPRSITMERSEKLRQIAFILHDHHTDYHIIVGPDWKRNIINPDDLATLQCIFGIRHVHDFSNYLEATDTIINFYDHTHYRPHVAKAILDSIYKK